MEAHKEESLNSFYISNLSVLNFRNYSTLRMNFSGLPVVLIGKNGAGKTNVLEMISMLAPGKGLRNCKILDMERIDSDNNRYPWSVSSIVNLKSREIHLGTGRDEAGEKKTRINKINNKVVRSQHEFAKVLSVSWVTPRMDSLFYGAVSDRRKFMDRLVYNFYPKHSSSLYSYDHAVKERLRVLYSGGSSKWISALELKIAEESVSIAIARNKILKIIQQYIFESQTLFPKVIVSAEGFVENLLKDNVEESECKEIVIKKLFENRDKDLISGKTNIGIHRSDLSAFHKDKNISASFCSTGEQKALLVSIILAELKAKYKNNQTVPVLLLDEIAAHLDSSKLESLLEELLLMKVQTWITGTDKERFSYLYKKAQFVKVANNKLEFTEN